MSTRVNEFQILNVDDAELMRVIQEGTLSLNWDETHAIQKHFAKLPAKQLIISTICGILIIVLFRMA